MPTGIPIPAPSATLEDCAGRAFAVDVGFDGLIGGVTVVDDVWEFDVGVDCKKDEEADEAVDEAFGDDDVDEDIEDSEDIDGSEDVDDVDDTAPDDAATALTTVMVE